MKRHRHTSNVQVEFVVARWPRSLLAATRDYYLIQQRRRVFARATGFLSGSPIHTDVKPAIHSSGFCREIRPMAFRRSARFSYTYPDLPYESIAMSALSLKSSVWHFRGTNQSGAKLAAT